MDEFDIGIIGGGPAGYTSALYAAKKGLSVVLYEKDCLGGTCLNRGCIPTKILLHISEVYNQIENCNKLGITAENVSFDYEKISEYKDKTVEKLRNSIRLLLKNSGVNLVEYEAQLKDEHTILANNQEYCCKRIVNCSGSKPREIKGLEFDNKFILNSDDLLNLKQLPSKMIIVGSGAIGIEFARLLSAFQVDITVVELAPQLIPIADWEISKRIERQFKMRKIKYYVGTSISEIDNSQVTLSNGEILETDCILVAAGRTPNIIENFGIETIGDASSEILLAHYAVSQAKKLMMDIPFRKDLIPSVIYGSPEIAWIGKCFKSQDDEAEYQKVVLPISALGKAHADNSIDGFIKIVAQNDKIVGAHIISNEASALIQQIAIIMQNDISISKLKEVCFAHPTYSEGIMEGIMQL